MSDWSLTPRLKRTYVSSTHHDHHHAVSSSGLSPSRVCEHSRARVTALRMCICRTRLTSTSSSMSADADVLRRALLAFLPPCLHVIPQSGIVASVSVRPLTHSCLNRKLKLPALIYTKHTVLSGRLAAELESAAAALSESRTQTQTRTRSAVAVHPRHPRCKVQDARAGFARDRT